MTKKKVLIVEDEKNIAQAEGLILSEHYDVSFAYDGDEGMQKLKEIRQT